MKIGYNTFTESSAALIRARYWRRISTGEVLNEGLTRSSMACKAGLASSFFVDETCWISACIASISFSKSDMMGVRSLAKLLYWKGSTETMVSDGMSDGFIEAKRVYVALMNVCLA